MSNFRRNWPIYLVIVVCIILLMVSGLIQYRQAQEIDELTELMWHMATTDSLQNEAIGILIQCVDGVQSAITPTHELPMMASHGRGQE